MPTKRTPQSGRASAKRAVRGARTAKAAGKKKPARVAPKVKAKVKRPTRATTKLRPKRAAESPEVTALKSRFQREKAALEKSLTEAVREIGLVRHHELRVTQLERQLQERDDAIAGLQQRLTDLERRPVEPSYEAEAQHSFALASPGAELDEFEDDNPLAEEDEI